MLKIFNTLGKKLEPFKPNKDKIVHMYNCGPTVYNYVQIGNLRAFMMADIIRRVLEYLGYEVKQVMNLTDVGHLVSDEDEGEDKMEKGAKRENKTVWEIAQMYIDAFNSDVVKMNFRKAFVYPRATEHIEEQIEMIKKLMEKGYAYQTKSAVYFDTSKFPGYGRLSGQHIEEKKVGVRDEVKVDPEKKNPQDFRLWQLDQPDHSMLWDSPWGKGFPGWHIECSAMSLKYLDQPIDIHTGGEDHIPVHHENEIAQAEAATGRKFVNYWYHVAFLRVDGEKMSKSKGNFYVLGDIERKGFNALDLRYFFLTSTFRQPQNFTWKALESARNSRIQLIQELVALLRKAGTGYEGEISEEYKKRFIEAVEDDFNIPKAFAVLWDLVRSGMEPALILGTTFDFDNVLGLNLESLSLNVLEKVKQNRESIEGIIKKRENFRKQKDWENADLMREKLRKEYGVELEDASEGVSWEIVDF